MIYFANAKINVGLFVSEKRDDGYHNIESNIYPIPLYDILEIIPAEDFHFQCSGIPIDPADNLVIKAFELTQSKYNIGNVFIHLHKQIPLGAGLGGGSSDAVACLKGLNEVFDLNLAKENMQELALQLGSDCPFFVENKAVHVSGRGEIFSESPLNLKGKYLKIIYPNIHISTEEAFAKLKIKPSPKSISEIDLTHRINNDFETWAFEKYPELKALRDQLNNEGAIINAGMTGTGSTIYGIFNKKPEKTTNYEFEKIMLLE